MWRIRLLVDIQTEISLLKAGRDLPCNHRDAATMIINKMAVLVSIE
jgi:molybdenum-dependent DNA-binding transcriptional regulator ModE